MKKVITGAAFLLLISIAHASSTAPAPEKGQPRNERNILSTQLPASLLANIKKDYKDYWITALSEAGKGKRLDYSITLENADQIVQLRSSNAKKWIITNSSEKKDL